jgi:hypothetical protein
MQHTWATPSRCVARVTRSCPCAPLRWRQHATCACVVACACECVSHEVLQPWVCEASLLRAAGTRVCRVIRLLGGAGAAPPPPKNLSCVFAAHTSHNDVTPQAPPDYDGKKPFIDPVLTPSELAPHLLVVGWVTGACVAAGVGSAAVGVGSAAAHWALQQRHECSTAAAASCGAALLATASPQRHKPGP